LPPIGSVGVTAGLDDAELAGTEPKHPNQLILRRRSSAAKTIPCQSQVQKWPERSMASCPASTVRRSRQVPSRAPARL